MDDRIDYTIAPWDRTDSVSRTLVRLITQSTNDGIWDWNLLTGEVYYSPRWMELVGYLPNELPGHIDTWTKLLHPDDRENAERTIAEYLASKRPEYRNEFRLQHKDGSWRWIFTHGIALREPGGRPVRFAGTHTDITDRVRAAERLEATVKERTIDLQAARDRAEATLRNLRDAQNSLIEAEKLAALGRLVAGVAHEVNSPIGVSLTVASTLEHKCAVFAADAAHGVIKRSNLTEFVRATREASSQLVANIKRASELVQSFKQVAADRHHSDLRAFDIGGVTEQIMMSLRAGLRKQPVHLNVECQPDLRVNSYPGPYGQVLTNLLLNAVMHAFPDGQSGTVDIRVKAFGEHEVEVLFADDGCGMNVNVRHEAFNPFFTTRRDLGCTGLGLHIVHNIVTSRLGGRLDLQSDPGNGTTIQMILPRIAPESEIDPI
jgi:PAS domain S-box-containing protein